ncbi:HAD family hydrolase [archaeon]|nr:MAG: HAD family hydrolase [archaeon]
MTAVGVFWDVDGTMSDSYQLGYSSTNEVLKQHGKGEISELEYHEGTKFTTPRRLAWHVTGDPDNVIGQQLGQEFDDLYVELVNEHTTLLYDGIKGLLEGIKTNYPSVHYAALSNACTAYVQRVIHVNNIDSMFGIALGADKVPQAKPFPHGLLYIAENLHIHPTRCVYIGDSPTDGQAAKAAGMHSIGVTWGSYSKEKIAGKFDEIVENAAALEVSLIQCIEKLLLQFD